MKTPHNGEPTDPQTLSSLHRQTARILNAKISAIARAEYARANPKPVTGHKRAKPYTLPAVVDTLRAMLSECADPATNAERLESIAAYATTGEVQERALGNRAA